MEGSGERGKVLRQCTFHGWPSLQCFILFVALLLWPARSFGQMDHIEAAARLLNQGQMDEAEAEARQGLKNPTSRALALAVLGTIRLQEARYAESTNFLTQALALNPHLVGARTTLGNAYQFQGKTGLARKSFQEALRLDPANFNARLDLAKVEASLHNFQKSLEVASPIVPQLSESDEGILLLATDYGALGQKDELPGLVRTWRLLPEPADESSLEFGDILAMSGMTLEAKEIFEAEERRIVASPSPTLALRLGRGYLSLGVLDGAERSFQLALTSSPDCSPCEQGLAEIAERQGNTEKALALLVAAKRQDPENPEILFAFGKVCLQRNLVEDALPALAKAVALKPSQDSYVYVLASANVAKGNLPKAASLLAGLLRKHPRDAILNYAIGAVYYLQAKYVEADSSLKQSLRTQPDQVAASYYLGLTFDAVGQDDQAEEVFRELLKKHPEHALSYVKLGSILFREHHNDEAQQLLERAVSLDPASVQAHYQLGLLLRRLGKTEESDQQLRESRRLESEHSAQTDVRLRLLLPD